ncbi:MAG: flavodoxin family protein [Actinobacteria bacterium]|nr:MAG: flavodoxin family protein [Actinomycetota bacterium]
MTRALVIYCHPLTGSFTEASNERVLAGLRAAGAEVRLTDLYADGFEPGYTAHDHTEPAVDPVVLRYLENLSWCDTLILVYPTWWAGPPSMLTGWIDRVWAREAARRHDGGNENAVPQHRNVRRLVAVTSHGSSKMINLVEGEAGRNTLVRSMRARCHSGADAIWIALYAIDSSTLAQREKFLRKVELRISNLR